MNASRNNQQGFILIISMLMLLIVTILVINSVRATTMNEKMSGAYMDRARAQNRAELAIAEGQGLLVSSSANAEICRDPGCAAVAGSPPSVTSHPATTALPGAWSDTGAVTSSDAKAKFLVTLLPDTNLPSAKNGKCKPYSIMGRGEGNDPRTTVVLQVVAFVCDLDA